MMIYKNRNWKQILEIITAMERNLKEEYKLKIGIEKSDYHNNRYNLEIRKKKTE